VAGLRYEQKVYRKGVRGKFFFGGTVQLKKKGRSFVIFICNKFRFYLLLRNKRKINEESV
jgi:hypothetical protein